MAADRVGFQLLIYAQADDDYCCSKSRDYPPWDMEFLQVTTHVCCVSCFIYRHITYSITFLCWFWFHSKRLENEHVNNVGKYRAFKTVPLPFNYDEDDDKDS